jgi:hypothetical protein
MSASAMTQKEWHIALVQDRIRTIERKLDTIHPVGAYAIYEWLCEARDEAFDGDMGRATELLVFAAEKLELEKEYQRENKSTVRGMACRA